MDKKIKRNKSLSLRSGFTLVEILVVIGILAIIASFGLYFSMDSFQGSSYRDELDLMTSSIQHARAQSMNNVCFGSSCIDGKPHGVHFYQSGDINDDKYVIFQGTSFDVDDEINQVIKFDNKTVYVDSASPIDIVFNRLSGDLILSGSETNKSIILKDGMGHSTTIEVNSEGRIDWWNN